LSLCLAICAASVIPVNAAELILPQERSAFYSDEPIELAVAGLAAGEEAAIELRPQGGPAGAVQLTVPGDGSTVTVALPPNALAPGRYELALGGAAAGTLTISSGVNDSTMLVSQTMAAKDVRGAGGNFHLSNAFSFGRLEGPRARVKDLRGHLSTGLKTFDSDVALDLPSICYMYWTGYVTHKPWGTHKCWADPDMTKMMRLFNFHVAQRLRRFDRNVLSIGTIDEPGLPWGPTPAGGAASGYPNWCTAGWYEQRGWEFTPDPASRPDEDWIKYVAIRCAIIGEQQAQAAKDIKTVWPEAVFSTDLYALHAMMDGTDTMNQRCNDIPSTHVFMDWGTGKLGIIGGLYLEKAHDPTAKVAHAMNGQLFGKRVPQPQHTYAYRLMLNGMLAAGLSSNWWLNWGGMEAPHLAAIHEPARRLGPLLAEMVPGDRDVAVLWSFTELGMRLKDITAKEAAKKTGEQIKLMVASLPENTAVKDKQMVVNAYNIGQNYKDCVLLAHQALVRAGFPAHIVDERLVAAGALKDYKVLLVVGQTFELPPAVRKAVDAFAAAGGKVVTDAATTVRFEGALTTEADLKDLGYRWAALFTEKAESFKSLGEASYFKTNHFMDAPARDAAAPLKATLARTPARQAVESDSPWLGAERHAAGEGAVVMVLNAHEQLPDIAEGEEYLIYNYAPLEATFTLRNVPAGSVVYRIQGADWKDIAELRDWDKPQTARFEPGEMKLFLVAPRRPEGLDAAATVEANRLRVTAGLKNVKMPWPIEVVVTGPQGAELFRVWRSMDAAGRYAESFPIGSNAPAGRYGVKVSALAGGFEAAAAADFAPAAARALPIAGVRVFDGPAIRAHLATRPAVAVAYGADAHKPLAEKLAADLAAKGVRARAVREGEVFRRARYPRVWNPFLRLYKPAGEEKAPPAEPQQLVTLSTDDDGTIRAVGADGKDLSAAWRKEGTLVTVGEGGYLDWAGDQEVAYEAGCKLYVGTGGQIAVLKGTAQQVKTTEEVKRAWSRPWTALTSHAGGYQLPPQLPEAYECDEHLVLLGDGTTSELVAALQASELLLQVADAKYPGPGKALVSFAWSPFAVEKNVVLVAAADEAGLAAGAAKLLELAGGK